MSDDTTKKTGDEPVRLEIGPEDLFELLMDPGTLPCIIVVGDVEYRFSRVDAPEAAPKTTIIVTPELKELLHRAIQMELLAKQVLMALQSIQVLLRGEDPHLERLEQLLGSPIPLPGPGATSTVWTPFGPTFRGLCLEPQSPEEDLPDWLYPPKAEGGQEA